jgi:hypothetical protein
MRKMILLFVFGLIVGVAQAGFAQDLADQAPPRAVQAKPVAPQGSTPTPQPTPTAAPAAPKEEPRTLMTPAKMINVQVEVTITDQIGTGAPNKKTVQLITSDNSVGRIRSRADAVSNRGGPLMVNLNVDAFPRVVGEQIQLNLTIEYNPLKTAADGSSEEKSISPTQLNQQLSIVMNSGKWMTVSQAADPVTDRKIIVECKATILK